MDDFEQFVAIFSRGGLYESRRSLLKSGSESEQKVAKLLCTLAGDGPSAPDEAGPEGETKVAGECGSGAHVRVPDVLSVETEGRLGDLAKLGNTVAEFVLSQYTAGYDDSFRSHAQAQRRAMQFLDGKLAEAYEGSPLPIPSVDTSDPTRYSTLLNRAGVVGQLWDGQVLGMPNRPGPLASMAVLGVLGAGAGRLGATAVDYFQGTHDKKRRNRMTALGAIAGLLPGLGYAAINASAGKPAFTGDVLNTPILDKKSGFRGTEIIPVEKLQDMIWNDPWVVRDLPPSLTSATSGLIEGASRRSPERRELPFVTPGDVGRMAVGLGSGYASGLMVGKVLGAMFGVSDTAQQTLRRSGAAAGLIKAVVPMAYGN